MLRLRGLPIVLILAACRPAGPPAGAPVESGAATRGKEPRVRVGLVVDSSRAVVGSTTSFDILVAGGSSAALHADASQTVTITADASGNLNAASSDGRTAGPFNAPLIVRPDRNGVVMISGRPYRGEALVRGGASGKVTAINVLDMEQYLLGVVPQEIGKRTAAEIEAVKAQAVAARTYAFGNMNGRAARGFDFYATDMDQVYRGFGGEDSVATLAVKETAGEIITYDDQPILAYYHSTCGGRTAAIEESWRSRAPLPYLKSVSDEIPGTDRSYCDLSNRYRWTQKWTADQLRSTLINAIRTAFGAEVHRIEDIRVDGKTPSGRLDKLNITADGRTYTVRGDSVRWVLRPDATRLLNSSLLFDVNTTVDHGEVSGLEVNGGGWGHGIGMCQWGAIGRARAGQSYREILATYYSGTKVTRLYK